MSNLPGPQNTYRNPHGQTRVHPGQNRGSKAKRDAQQMCQLSLGLRHPAKAHAHSHTHTLSPHGHSRTNTHCGMEAAIMHVPPTHRALWCEQPAASRAPAGTVLLFSSSSAPAPPKHHRYIQPKPAPCCPAPVPMSPWKHRNTHTHTIPLFFQCFFVFVFKSSTESNS